MAQIDNYIIHVQNNHFVQKKFGWHMSSDTEFQEK